MTTVRICVCRPDPANNAFFLFAHYVRLDLDDIIVLCAIVT